MASIRGAGPYRFEGDYGATSGMTAVMGRMATYSGKLVTWDEAIHSELHLRRPLCHGRPAARGAGCPGELSRGDSRHNAGHVGPSARGTNVLSRAARRTGPLRNPRVESLWQKRPTGSGQVCPSCREGLCALGRSKNFGPLTESSRRSPFRQKRPTRSGQVGTSCREGLMCFTRGKNSPAKVRTTVPSGEGTYLISGGRELLYTHFRAGLRRTLVPSGATCGATSMAPPSQNDRVLAG